jgi:regulator of protease activity HflC (stomatin/prohibitin superfamily)
MEYLVIIAVAVMLLVGVYLRTTLVRVTVFEFERALKYRNGRFVGTLGPGLHWMYRPRVLIRKVDIRPRSITIGGQEVLSEDGVTLKVSLAVEYEIADPALAVNTVENADMALYLTLQLALREIVGQSKIDDVLARRDEFGRRLLELGAARAEDVGLRLIRVDVRDIMFPGELKKMFAQVVQAQKEGQAALEKVRAETAALRGLANAARMVDGNPSLLQLRLLQQLASSAGNTVVLGFPTGGTPLPLKDRKGELPEPTETPPDEEPAT